MIFQDARTSLRRTRARIDIMNGRIRFQLFGLHTCALLYRATLINIKR